MTNEQRQQLLNSILAGKTPPQSDVQAHLLGMASRMQFQLLQEQAEAQRRAASLQEQQEICARVAGAKDQAIADLRNLLVDPAPPPATATPPAEEKPKAPAEPPTANSASAAA